VYSLPGSKCREGGIVHFQGWKHVFYSFATSPPPLDTHTMLVTESGLIPLRLPRHWQLPNYNETANVVDIKLSSFGRLRREEIFINPLYSKKPLRRVGDEITSSQVESISDREDVGPHPRATSYCAVFDADLASCRCPVLRRDVEVLKRSSGRRASLSKSDITLLVTDWAYEGVHAAVLATLSSWTGPAVLVLAAYAGSGSVSQYVDSFIDKLPSSVDVILVHLSSCYPMGERPNLPDNMLLNMAMDIANTDIVCIASRGFVFSSIAHLDTSRQLQELSSRGVGSPAVVFPMFKFTGGESGGEPSGSRTALGRCGMQQPLALLEDVGKRLRLDSSEDSPTLRIASFGDLLVRYALMSPVAFNRSQCAHGSSFVRLPEELNGHGCYGATALAVLLGSGYTLHWARDSSVGTSPPQSQPPQQSIKDPERNQTTAMDKNQQAQRGRWNHCGCVSVQRPRNPARDRGSRGRSADTKKRGSVSDDPVVKFFRVFARYYARATLFRQTGILGIHSKEPFSTRFDKEQFDLGLYNA